KLNRVFNRVVRRLLARTTKVALEETYRDVRVIISSESTFGRVNPMVSSVSFEKKEPVVSFLRFLARNMDHPITIDIEDYYDHPENDIIVEALSCFPSWSFMKLTPLSFDVHG
ncbi:toxin-antitoxin system, toxin component, HicA domain protein, partial [Oesophagostomum dentatum]